MLHIELQKQLRTSISTPGHIIDSSTFMKRFWVLVVFFVFFFYLFFIFWVLVFLKSSPHSVTQAEAVLLSCGLSYEITWVCHHSRFKSKHLCLKPTLPLRQAKPGIEPGSWLLPHLQYFPLSCIPTIICRGGGALAYEVISFWYVALQWKSGC